MSKSILSNEQYCYVCGTPLNLHKHHIFYGTSNRKQSEKYGCWVYLCAYHHNMSNEGVHFNKELDNRLKEECQRVYECTETRTGRTETPESARKAFIDIFGRSYL